MNEPEGDLQDDIDLLFILSEGAAGSREEAMRALQEHHGDLEAALQWLKSEQSCRQEDMEKAAKTAIFADDPQALMQSSADQDAHDERHEIGAEDATRLQPTDHVDEVSSEQADAVPSTPSLGIRALATSPGAVAVAGPGMDGSDDGTDDDNTVLTNSESVEQLQHVQREQPIIAEAATVYDDDREILLQRVEELEARLNDREIVQGELMLPDQQNQEIVPNDDESNHNDETCAKEETQAKRQLHRLIIVGVAVLLCATVVGVVAGLLAGPASPPAETLPTTAIPTETEHPTVSPTMIPSSTVQQSTPLPTDAPTEEGATPSPTQEGSTVPPEMFPNLTMTLLGMSPLSASSWDVFESEYRDFNTAFYLANPQFGITDVDIVLAFVSQDPLSRRRLNGGRQIQSSGSELRIVYNQAIIYRISPNSDMTSAEVVQQPFASQSSRDAFTILLFNSGFPDFANIASVSPVTQETASDPSSSPTEQVEDTSSTTSPQQPLPPLQRFSAEGVVMIMSPMEPLTLVGISIWRDKTTAFIQAEIEEQFSRGDGDDDGSSSSVSVMPGSVRVSIDVDWQEPPLKRQRQLLRERHLQQSQPMLNITFSTLVSLRSDSIAHDVYSFIFSAFDSHEEQSSYIETLKDSDYQTFQQLETISVVNASNADLLS